MRKPHLYRPKQGAKDKRVYIRVPIWDVQKEKFYIRRMYAHNGVNFTDNPYFAQTVCDHIEQEINDGLVIDRTQKPIKYEQKKPNPDTEVTAALEWALTFKQRIRPKTLVTYRSHFKAFKHFIDSYYNGLPLSSVNKEVIEQFFVHLKNNRKIGTLTITNFTISLKALFSILVEMEWMKKNPMKGFKTTSHEMNKNFAYSDKQKFELIDYATNFPYIQFGMRFMYYTLLRSSEMTRIQIKEIGMQHRGQLYLPAEKSKVGRERNVMLHPAIIRFIEENKIDRLPGDWYLFGLNFKPSEKQWHAGEIGKYYRKKILNPLGYDTRYSFISWKHTGVCTLHKNGVPDYQIMNQAGWSTYKAFQNYLKSLGLQGGVDVIDKIDEI